jgi:DedD protein
MMGMTVLVVVAVALLSWLLETEPRPPAQEIRIVSAVPSELQPSVMVIEPAPKPAASEPALPAQVSETLSEGEEMVEMVPAVAKPAIPKPVSPKPVPPKPAAKPPVKTASAPDVPAAKTPPVSSARYVVQVGAFTDVAIARATRLKVEALGLKTYTQVVQTPAGRKIRVRLGPFASEAEAQRVLTTVRKAGVIGGILTL